MFMHEVWRVHARDQGILPVRGGVDHLADGAEGVRGGHEIVALADGACQRGDLDFAKFASAIEGRGDALRSDLA